jgi:Secretion system C-terminal sorting domain
MKTRLFISLLILAITQPLQAQLCGPALITGTIPSVVTAGSPFQVTTAATFCSGGCDRDHFTLQEGLDFIEIHSYYCPGMLAVICDTQDTTDLAGVPPGVYTIYYIVYVSNDCINFTPADTVMDTLEVIGTAIPEDERLANVIVYPNPSENDFSVFIPETVAGRARFTCYNSLGQCVWKSESLNDGAAICIPLGDAAPGLYELRVESEAGVAVKKLLKE